MLGYADSLSQHVVYELLGLNGKNGRQSDDDLSTGLERPFADIRGRWSIGSTRTTPGGGTLQSRPTHPTRESRRVDARSPPTLCIVLTTGCSFGRCFSGIGRRIRSSQYRYLPNPLGTSTADRELALPNASRQEGVSMGRRSHATRPSIEPEPPHQPRGPTVRW